MKIYTFRCSKKPDLFAVSLEMNGGNLPPNLCAGQWLSINEETVQPGDRVVGFVSRDLFRDLSRQGFHLAIGGVRVKASNDEIAIGQAMSAANLNTKFFDTDA